jgi:uncharacterized membrane protein (DUF2068 family)
VKLSKPGRARSTGLVLIGFYKFFEGLLLIVAGLGALKLIHRNVGGVAFHWVHILRLDPDNHYIHKFLVKAFNVTPKQLKELSAGTFIYAALRLIEGIGLILRKIWAEYLVVIATGIFIPLEIYELIRRFTTLRLVLLLANVAIVLYLLSGLRRASASPLRVAKRR